MKDIKAKILSNEKIYSGYFKMAIAAPGIMRDARPGQFVQIRCSNSLDPLLRRPFSIHRLKAPLGFVLRRASLAQDDPEPVEWVARDRQGSPRLRSGQARLKGIEILYEVVGKGTEILSTKKTGDFIDVLGPLGNGFTLPPFTIHHSPFTILIAGGIGVAPLVFLAEELAKKKIKTIVLIGAKTKKLILCEKIFKELATKVNIATDDGSRGYKGFVSELFEEVLRDTRYDSRFTIYACGPHPMLQCIAKISKEQKIECQVSLEEKMACGIGACLGCIVKVKGKARHKLACKDGPVFDASQIIWC